jgi:hypothetical protein
VPDAEAVVAYVASMTGMTTEQEAEVRARVTTPFRIRKNTVLVTARADRLRASC